MGTLEYIFWHVLGYTAIPVILLAGFTAVVLMSFPILSLIEKKIADD